MTFCDFQVTVPLTLTFCGKRLTISLLPPAQTRQFDLTCELSPMTFMPFDLLHCDMGPTWFSGSHPFTTERNVLVNMWVVRLNRKRLTVSLMWTCEWQHLLFFSIGVDIGSKNWKNIKAFLGQAMLPVASTLFLKLKLLKKLPYKNSDTV